MEKNEQSLEQRMDCTKDESLIKKIAKKAVLPAKLLVPALHGVYCGIYEGLNIQGHAFAGAGGASIIRFLEVAGKNDPKNYDTPEGDPFTHSAIAGGGYLFLFSVGYVVGKMGSGFAEYVDKFL